MAGLAEVSAALVARIAQIVYPNGTGQPSITGKPVKIYGGWPSPGVLTKDLAAGKVHISVFPPNGMEKLVDSAVSEWRELVAPEITLSLTLAGQTVTVGGSVSTPQNMALVVDGKGYVHGVQSEDTLTSIATALAAMVSADQPASSAGPVITIPGAKAISPRVGGAGSSIRELRRQERPFRITIWANCFDSRDPLADLLDAELAGTFHLVLPDGMLGTLRYKSSSQDDSGQKESVYRRDLIYAVEFSTTQVRTDTQITITETNVSAGPTLVDQFPIATIVE